MKLLRAVISILRIKRKSSTIIQSKIRGIVGRILSKERSEAGNIVRKWCKHYIERREARYLTEQRRAEIREMAKNEDNNEENEEEVRVNCFSNFAVELLI